VPVGEVSTKPAQGPQIVYCNQVVRNYTLQELTFEQIDALIGLIEFHDDWDEVSDIVGTNVSLLHDNLTEMRDAVTV